MAASIELLHPDDDPALAGALVMLQRAAYAVEARLIGHDIPVRAETTAELVDIERLVVAPHAARRGIGAALVGHVLAQAAGRRVAVATGRDNAPARRLYERAGFAVVADVEVAPGRWVTRYAREP